MKLSKTELYYTEDKFFQEGKILISGDEFKHITKVMRHSAGDEIYVSNGKGKIFPAHITDIEKQYLSAEIKEEHSYDNRFKNITFCIPKIKNSDRLEFALEKCVELGITNFIIYESERSYKKGEKPDRWNRILLAAMKQSLRSYLPEIKILSSVADIQSLPGNKIVLEQNSEKKFKEIRFNDSENYFLIFGPEGGLTEREIDLFGKDDIYSLTDNRLRSETAIITCASLITVL